MISAYRRLWVPEGATPPGIALGGLLFSVSLGIPLALSMSVYAPLVTIVTLGAVGALVGAVLFFDVRRFVLFAFPAVFIIAVPNIILAITIVLTVSFLSGLLQSGRLRIKVPFPLLFLVLGLSLVNGLVQAADRDDARYVMQYQYLIPLVVFFILYNLKLTSRDIRASLVVVSILAALIGWVSLAMYIQTGMPRVVFRWNSQNLGASFLGLILPFVLISLIDARRLSARLFWVLLLVGIGAGIMVTQTRAILLGSMLAVLYISLKDRAAMKIMLPLLIASAVAAPALILSRIATLLGRGQYIDWSAVGRVEIWLNSIKCIPDHFLFGLGIGGFDAMYRANYPSAFIEAIHAHNIYLFLLFELGLVGMLSYVTIFLACLKRGHGAVSAIGKSGWSEASRILLALNAGVLSLLAAGMVDSYLRCTRVSILFWSFLAFQLLLARQLQQREEG